MKYSPLIESSSSSSYSDSSEVSSSSSSISYSSDEDTTCFLFFPATCWDTVSFCGFYCPSATTSGACGVFFGADTVDTFSGSGAATAGATFVDGACGESAVVEVELSVVAMATRTILFQAIRVRVNGVVDMNSMASRRNL